MQQQLRNVIKRGNKHYVVSTCWTDDHGWETMVFECNNDGVIINWTERDNARYRSQRDAMDGHADIVKNFVAP